MVWGKEGDVVRFQLWEKFVAFSGFLISCHGCVDVDTGWVIHLNLEVAESVYEKEMDVIVVEAEEEKYDCD